MLQSIDDELRGDKAQTYAFARRGHATLALHSECNRFLCAEHTCRQALAEPGEIGADLDLFIKARGIEEFFYGSNRRNPLMSVFEMRAHFRRLRLFCL